MGRGKGSAPEECEEHRGGTLVRPIPSAPENTLAGAAAQAMSRMALPVEGFRNRDKSFLARPGLCRPPWASKHVMAGRGLQTDSRSEDHSHSGMTVETTLVKEPTEGSPGSSAGRSPSPSHYSTSAGPSHHTMSPLPRYEDSALAQQARKAASMYVNPLQNAFRNAPIGAPRTSPLGDEAQMSHPVPLYSRMQGIRTVENGQSPPQQQQQQPVHGAHPLARPTGAGKHPRTAQLTIFYAGMVNVYDDVPLDKAQAIMLLAGTGNAWSSSNYADLSGSGGASARPFSVPGGMSQPTTSRAGSPAPQMTTTPNGMSLGAMQKVNRQVPTTTTGLIVELPQARKASLARFLEKRKDRVRKGPYTHPNDEAAGRTDMSTRLDELRSRRENSPNHPFPISKPQARPLSPPATQDQHSVPLPTTANAGHVQVASTSGSEPSSPPQTPPRQSMSEDRSHGVIASGWKECDSSMVTTVAGSDISSPSRGELVVATSGPEPMNEHS